jgi:hypothetical protein
MTASIKNLRLPNEVRGYLNSVLDVIRILGAISLDNEITREYVSTMKEFHRTFKPLPNHSIIQQQFAPHVYVHHTMPVITDTKPNTSLINGKAIWLPYREVPKS